MKRITALNPNTLLFYPGTIQINRCQHVFWFILICSLSVTGSPRSGGFITNSSTATQYLERKGELSASARAVVIDSDGIVGDSAGDTIEYTIELTNTGTTSLTSISVSSALLLDQYERYDAHYNPAKPYAYTPKHYHTYTRSSYSTYTYSSGVGNTGLYPPM